jgi:PelA/Pel-15E family pectate lyase
LEKKIIHVGQIAIDCLPSAYQNQNKQNKPADGMMENAKTGGIRMRQLGLWLVCLTFVGVSVPDLSADEDLKAQSKEAMVSAAQFFRNQVATRGGYLWAYNPDFSVRQGENSASATTIWIQPPGTPSIGMVYLEAYEATGDTLFLNGAVEAARALVWGQLASGGWDYRIDFDAEESKKWHYRRDVEAGDKETGKRRNRTTLDDNNTQSAFQLLMRVDKVLDFKDAEIHNAVMYGLDALLKAQYPNGSWPQRYEEFPQAADFSVNQARYPQTWSRTFPEARYYNFYTFNDNSIADIMGMMAEAYHTYDDARYIDAAKRGGEFMILAQMPEPQPVWAQQYNLDMEPSWARKFEPPSVTGGETFGIMKALLDVYVETGDEKFLAPIPRALVWAKRSLLPDGRLARFYELKTNTPLYFTKDDYVLTYDDSNMPTHYAFKVSGNRIERIEKYYDQIMGEGREAVMAKRNLLQPVDEAQVQEIVAALDDQGRWISRGRLRDPDHPRERIASDVISCRTFYQNMRTLARYVKMGQ